MAGTTYNYEILEIKFSAREKVEGSEEEFTQGVAGSNKVEKSKSTRITELVAHAFYRYRGWDTSEEYGTAVVVLDTLTKATVDEDGDYTSLTQGSLSEYDAGKILEIVDPIVQKQIASSFYRAAEVSHVKSSLARMNSLEGLPSTKYSSRGTEGWTI